MEAGARRPVCGDPVRLTEEGEEVAIRLVAAPSEVMRLVAGTARPWRLAGLEEAVSRTKAWVA